MDWQSTVTWLPVFVLWMWHTYRIDAVQNRIAMLEIRLQEEKNAAINASMLRAVQESLERDDLARAIHGLPESRGAKAQTDKTKPND